MANIWCEEAARTLLGCCLRGEPRPGGLLELLLEEKCGGALFGVVAEGLADRFEPALCDAYAELFSEALAALEPELTAGELLARYRRIRRPRKFTGAEPRKIYVLSRVTLGADVAITSVVLDAVKQRFPESQILLAGSRKAWELFEADSRIGHLAAPYPRGGPIRDRLEAWRRLRRAVAEPGSIVVDPDSRLTQLGLAPVCEEEDYYFFESRGYGGDGDEPLGALTQRWTGETFGQRGRAYIAPAPVAAVPAVCVSLGVGGNPAKRIGGGFERGLLRALVDRGARILIDKGAGGEEEARVNDAIAGLPADRVECWNGAFAPFAARIAQARMYIGYDSAGQHVAAACGVPMVTVFAGFASGRMLARWRPTGPAPIEVVRVDDPDPDATLARTLEAVGRLANLPPNMA
ncbi:MAG TPA: glycosyltransferase family 9 protein [Bryobacteraceae bacterium]|nr:glycosyltransferase family 9 protein [Bryobacteraceae bacterium]